MNTKTIQFNSLEEFTEHYREEHNIKSGFTVSENQPDHEKEVRDSVTAIDLGNHVIVGFLIHDDYPSDYWENNDGAGELQIFSSKSDYESILKAVTKSKKLFYLVDKYEHGNVHYSIASSNGYPDQQWDVSHGCGVFIPCDDIQQEFKKMKKNHDYAEAFEYFIKDSNAILDDYSNWCNGEVYGHQVITYSKDGKFLNEDTCFGYIGSDYAESEKLNTMKSIVQDFQVQDLKKEIDIISKEPINAKELNFRIEKKDLESFQYIYLYDHQFVVAHYKEQEKGIVYTCVDGQKRATKYEFTDNFKTNGLSIEASVHELLKYQLSDVIRKELSRQELQKKANLSI